MLHGPFDVVLDDAGHVPHAQVVCYEYMINHVKPGGYYILEDIMDPGVVNFLADIVRRTIVSQDPKVDSIAFSYGTSVTKIRP